MENRMVFYIYLWFALVVQFRLEVQNRIRTHLLLPPPSLQIEISPSTIWEGEWRQGSFDDPSPFETSRLTVVMKPGRTLVHGSVSWYPPVYAWGSKHRVAVGGSCIKRSVCTTRPLSLA